MKEICETHYTVENQWRPSHETDWQHWLISPLISKLHSGWYKTSYHEPPPPPIPSAAAVVRYDKAGQCVDFYCSPSRIKIFSAQKHLLPIKNCVSTWTLQYCQVLYALLLLVVCLMLATTTKYKRKKLGGMKNNTHTPPASMLFLDEHYNVTL